MKEPTFTTGRGYGKRLRQLMALRRAIAIGEHSHDASRDLTKCWNGNESCPAWVAQDRNQPPKP